MVESGSPINELQTILIWLILKKKKNNFPSNCAQKWNWMYREYQSQISSEVENFPDFDTKSNIIQSNAKQR